MTPSSRPRTLSIGGATLDLFVTIDHRVIADAAGLEVFALPLGEKLRVRKIVGALGGGACNTSVGLARLGCAAGFCGVVGDDQWGDQLLKGLHKEKVETSHATVVEHETSSFSIVLNSDSGERVILYDPGTNAHLHDVTFDRESAAGMDWIYLNHIQPDSCEIEDDMIRMLTTIEDLRLTWNPGGCQIDAGVRAKNNRELLAQTTLLLLNKQEALRFAQTRTIDQALHILREAGATNVCITDGRRGAVATDGTTRFTCPTGEAAVVDTTGAGDAFGTAMTWALATGLDLPTAMRAGTMNAMSVVGAIGAQPGLLTDTEMTRKLAEHTLDVQSSPF